MFDITGFSAFVEHHTSFQTLCLYINKGYSQYAAEEHSCCGRHSFRFASGVSGFVSYLQEVGLQQGPSDGLQIYNYVLLKITFVTHLFIDLLTLFIFSIIGEKYLRSSVSDLN